jgi:hypothetical protein
MLLLLTAPVAVVCLAGTVPECTAGKPVPASAAVVLLHQKPAERIAGLTGAAVACIEQAALVRPAVQQSQSNGVYRQSDDC